MRAVRSPAARDARAAFAELGGGARVHTRVRQWMAPFEALEALVPREGLVLDLGCGRGVFTVQLALASAARRIHAVDVSPSRVRQAREAARAAGVADRVSFEVVDPRWDLGEGRYDAVVVSDVLYLLDEAAIVDLVTRMCRGLRPGGVLVVKEVDATPRWKHRVTWSQELVSVRLLHLSAGEALNLRPLATVAHVLAGLGWSGQGSPLDRGYPYSHAAIVATKPA